MGLAAEAQLICRLATNLMDEYKDWMPGSTSAEKEAWIREAMAYGRKYGITGTAALRALISCIAGYSLPVPLPPGLEPALRAPGYSEHARIEELLLRLRGERHQLIPLQI